MGQVDTASLESSLAAVIDEGKTPGLQYVAVGADGVLFEFAGGLADIRRRVTVEPLTTMMAYSMSKTITAVAVLQLVDAGKIRLDDPVEHYIDISPYGPHVTVRQLLDHTSGIPNPIPLRWVHLSTTHARFEEDVALAEVLRKHRRLAFEPGTRFAYSNIGYWLLGKIVEQAAGEPFQSFVRQRVFVPLGITAQELGYLIETPAHHAVGYLEKYSLLNLAKGLLIDRALVGEYVGRWLEIRSHYLNGPAFGGLVASARGFGKFLQDQCRATSVLLSDSTRALLYTAQQTVRGAPVPMTLGWHIGRLGNTRFFYKEGGGGGFHSMMRVYPDPGVGTVVMSNATSFDTRRLLNAADAFFVTRANASARR